MDVPMTFEIKGNISTCACPSPSNLYTYVPISTYLLDINVMIFLTLLFFSRGSMAENNFQLRVRKRGSDFGHQPSLRNSAESNFQLRVRKDFLDRLRSSPQVRER